MDIILSSFSLQVSNPPPTHQARVYVQKAGSHTQTRATSLTSTVTLPHGRKLTMTVSELTGLTWPAFIVNRRMSLSDRMHRVSLVWGRCGWEWDDQTQVFMTNLINISSYMEIERIVKTVFENAMRSGRVKGILFQGSYLRISAVLSLLMHGFTNHPVWCAMHFDVTCGSSGYMVLVPIFAYLLLFVLV